MSDLVTVGDCRIYVGDCVAAMKAMPAESVHCVITSPPYWRLRDYGVEGQYGLEQTPAAFVEQLVTVFREVRRVLRDDGTLWLNLGDSYAGSRAGWQGKNGLLKDRNIEQARAIPSKHVAGLKPKDLVGIPWRVALALQADGWYLRSDIIWHKPAPLPESAKDRPGRAHEYLFLLSKRPKYFYDRDAIRQPLSAKSLTAWSAPRRGAQGDALDRGKFAGWGRDLPGDEPSVGADGKPRGANRRTVWTVAPTPYHGAHFATFPTELVRPCVRAGCPVGGTVLDPFGGSGTTAVVALQEGRKAVLCELNEEYVDLAVRRIQDQAAQLTLYEALAEAANG